MGFIPLCYIFIIIKGDVTTLPAGNGQLSRRVVVVVGEEVTFRPVYSSSFRNLNLNRFSVVCIRSRNLYVFLWDARALI